MPAPEESVEITKRIDSWECDRYVPLPGTRNASTVPNASEWFAQVYAQVPTGEPIYPRRNEEYAQHAVHLAHHIFALRAFKRRLSVRRWITLSFSLIFYGSGLCVSRHTPLIELGRVTRRWVDAVAELSRYVANKICDVPFGWTVARYYVYVMSLYALRRTNVNLLNWVGLIPAPPPSMVPPGYRYFGFYPIDSRNVPQVDPEFIGLQESFIMQYTLCSALWDFITLKQCGGWFDREFPKGLEAVQESNSPLQVKDMYQSHERIRFQKVLGATDIGHSECIVNVRVGFVPTRQQLLKLSHRHPYWLAIPNGSMDTFVGGFSMDWF